MAGSFHAGSEAFLSFGGGVAFYAPNNATETFSFEAGVSDGDFVAQEGVEYSFAGEGFEVLVFEGHFHTVNPTPQDRATPPKSSWSGPE